MPALNAWDRAWHGPTCAARPSLLARALLLVFAFDAVVLMAAHASRYGDGGFNVAHFGFLDALPVPTPALYLAVLLLAAGVSLAQSLSGPTPVGMALALALQAYAWMMSRLDSFQHHYLLSLLLLCLALSGGALAGGARRVPAWGFRLAGATLALVYLFASIAKLEPGWAGSFLGHRAGLVAFARDLGLGTPEKAMALGVAGGEIFVGLSYAAAALWPEPRPRWLERALLVSLAAAVGFHAGVQLLGVRIGWFSVYAIAAAAAFFLPGEAIARAGAAVERADARVQETLSRLPAGMVALAGAIAAVAIGALVDLPGSLAAGAGGASLILAAAFRGRRQLATLGGVGALLLGTAILLTPVRFDYWRYAGGDAMRRGDPATALDAYRRAEAHAPAGESRQDRIRQLSQP